MFRCDITDATLEVGQILNSDWPFYFSATLKGPKVRCTKDSVLQWEVPLDSMKIEVWRAIVILGIDLRCIATFGELWLQFQAGWNQDDIMDADKWSGRASNNLTSTTPIVKVSGTWVSTRRP
jgi:hypothetical protein